MRLSRLTLLLTACALSAFAAPAVAQDAPAIGVPQTGDSLPPPVAPAMVIDNEAVAPPPPAAVVPIPADWSPIPTDEMGRTAYGLYLSGRLAALRGDTVTGADLLAQSQALTPEQPVVGEEAFRTGLFAGDLATLAELAPSVQDNPLLAEAARLVVIVEAFTGGDATASLATLRAQPFAEPFETIGQYLLPSVAAAAGDWELALKPVAAPPTDVDALVLRHQRARLLESRRRYADAEAEYRVLTASPLGAQLFAIDFGRFLERRGRRDEALTLYASSLTGPLPDPEAVIGRTRVLERAAPPPLPTIRENAAFAIKLAAIQSAEQRERDVSTIFLRLADNLGPNDEVALRLGLGLVALGHEDSARVAFGRVSRDNPVLFAGAQFGLGLSYQQDDRSAEALEAFRLADTAAPAQAEVIFKLAQQLGALGRHEEALAVLNRVSVNVAGQPPGLRFQRGVTLEALGRLEEAEAELWAALMAAPNEPGILNHLGYMWVDTGRRVEQGAEMLARAHAAEPANGNIQDSLGWAQFRQGQYDIAVETLEGAVTKEPANAEINDHLGDAYWQVGRRREAHWQWNRVLTLDPDAERRAEVEQKLVDGLSVAPPVSAGQF